MPVATVIIPAYNAERFLAHTIASVQAQTRPDWLLIVIDDGSKDGTVALAEALAAQDARIRVAPYPNGGVVTARNRGFAESPAAVPYIAYLDHDDVWEPDFLETLTAVLEANPAAVGAQGVARYIDSAGRPCEAFGGTVWPRERFGVVNGQVREVEPDAPTSFALIAVTNYIATPGQVLFRREALERVGLFHPDTNPCDDWDLYMRLTQQGDIAFVNKIVMGWRQHEGNVSKDRKRMVRMGRYVRRKLMQQPDLSASNRLIAKKGYRYLQQSSVLPWLKSAQYWLKRRNFVRAASHVRFALRTGFRALFGLFE